MILPDIAKLILTKLRSNDRVIDIGGARFPWFRANVIIDKRTFEQRIGMALPPDGDAPPCFSSESWISRDFYDLPWPFKDKEFDFSLCMGTLEDLRDPLPICREIIRISKAGYISTPTRAAESYIAVSEHPQSNKLYGYFHHRWFVEIIKDALVFKFKHPLLYQNNSFIPTSFGQHTLNFFWEKNFEYREDYLGSHEEALGEAENFFREHEQWLESIDKSVDEIQRRYNHWPANWGIIPDFLGMEIKSRNKINIKKSFFDRILYGR